MRRALRAAGALRRERCRDDVRLAALALAAAAFAAHSCDMSSNLRERERA